MCNFKKYFIMFLLCMFLWGCASTKVFISQHYRGNRIEKIAVLGNRSVADYNDANELIEFFIND